MEQNDKKAQFSSIYDQYIGKIYRFVYLKVSSKEVAEDITSKVFLKGWEAYSGQSNILNPSSFLYRIASNAVVDHYRDKGKIKFVSEEAFPKVADNRTNLHNKAIIDSDVEMVRLAMKDIKPEYQDILIWHYLDGMDIDEISDITQKPAGTVRVMLHRGLKDLRAELGSKIQES